MDCALCAFFIKALMISCRAPGFLILFAWLAAAAVFASQPFALAKEGDLSNKRDEALREAPFPAPPPAKPLAASPSPARKPLTAGAARAGAPRAGKQEKYEPE